MRYKGYFSFTAKDDEAHNNDNLQVNSFDVTGGTNPVVKLKSTDDISISIELEQARNAKSLTVFLTEPSGAKAAKATVDLFDISSNQLDFYFMLTVEKYSGKKVIEGLGLTATSVLSAPPSIVPGNLLMLKLEFDDIKIYQGKIINHQIVKNGRKEL